MSAFEKLTLEELFQKKRVNYYLRLILEKEILSGENTIQKSAKEKLAILAVDRNIIYMASIYPMRQKRKCLNRKKARRYQMKQKEK